MRYIGPVTGTSTNEDWVGIEWDDVTHGKHDGLVHSVRYFQTSHSTGGSFVKRSKVVTGDWLLSCLSSRLEELEWRSDELLRVGGGDVRIYARGLGGLDTVDLSGWDVCDVDKGLGTVLHATTNLRLRGCLLGGPATHRILDELGHVLHRLDVAENRLETGGSGAHTAVRELVVNGCVFGEHVLQGLLRRMTQLETLRAWGCGLQALHAWEMLGRVRVVDVGGNAIGWGEIVRALGASPVQTLYAGGNAGWGEEECVQLEGRFRALETLGVEGNGIEEWDWVERLAGVRGLRRLGIRGNGVMKGRYGLSGRMETIGRLRNVQTVDGSEVGSDERVWAERMYVAKVVQRDVRECGEEEACRRHGRLKELRELYGTVQKAERGRKGGWMKVQERSVWMAQGVDGRRVRKAVERLAGQKVRGLRSRENGREWTDRGDGDGWSWENVDMEMEFYG